MAILVSCHEFYNQDGECVYRQIIKDETDDDARFTYPYIFQDIHADEELDYCLMEDVDMETVTEIGVDEVLAWKETH